MIVGAPTKVLRRLRVPAMTSCRRRMFVDGARLGSKLPGRPWQAGFPMILSLSKPGNAQGVPIDGGQRTPAGRFVPRRFTSPVDRRSRGIGSSRKPSRVPAISRAGRKPVPDDVHQAEIVTFSPWRTAQTVRPEIGRTSKPRLEKVAPGRIPLPSDPRSLDVRHVCDGT